MTWPMFAQLLLQFGPRAFDLAEKLIANWTNPAPLTIEDIQAAKKLGLRSPRDAMIEALIRGNIPLDSPEALALLGLVPQLPAAATA